MSRSAARLLPCVLLAALLLAVGCGTDEDPGADASGRPAPTTAVPSETPAESASPSTTASATPGASDTPEAPSTTATPSSSPSARGPETRLLAAEELPGLNAETRWRAVGTGPEGSSPTGECQLTPLVDIGAVRAVARDFTARGDSTARHVVARFADTTSAQRAEAVLRSWHGRCAGTVDAEEVEVGPLVRVEAPDGSGAHYLLRYGDRGAELQTFSGTAMARRGTWISVVRIATVGQDHNYAEGEEPAALAARVALSRLG